MLCQWARMPRKVGEVAEASFDSLPRLIKDVYGRRVSIPVVDSELGDVWFVLYESFVFKCGIGKQYQRFGLGMLLEGIAITQFFGKRVTMETDEDAIRASLHDVDRFCRLRLPQEFLDEFSTAMGGPQE